MGEIDALEFKRAGIGSLPEQTDFFNGEFQNSDQVSKPKGNFWENLNSGLTAVNKGLQTFASQSSAPTTISPPPQNAQVPWGPIAIGVGALAIILLYNKKGK